MKYIAFFLFSFSTVCVLNAQSEKPLTINRSNYEAWMPHIKPSESELRWTQIDWQPDLKTGIAKAAESGKPILLWTMNGHPLGCT